MYVYNIHKSIKNYTRVIYLHYSRKLHIGPVVIDIIDLATVNINKTVGLNVYT